MLCNLNNVESNTVKRNFYKGDYSAVRDLLSSVKWSEMISMDIQESWDLLIKHVSDCVEKFVPLKRQNPNKVKSKWLDAHCLRCVKKKSKAWNRYLHTRDQRDYMKYCAARNKATKATIYAKKNYERNIAQNIQENPKNFWSYVRSKTKARTGVAGVSTQLQSSGLVAHENSTFRNLALAVSGPFMA